MSLPERIRPFVYLFLSVTGVGIAVNVQAQDWQEHYVLNQGTHHTWTTTVGLPSATLILSPDPQLGTATVEISQSSNALTVKFFPVLGAVGVAEFIVEYWPEGFPPHPEQVAFRMYVVDSYVKAVKDYASVIVNSQDNTLTPLDNDVGTGAPPLMIEHIPVVRNGSATLSSDGLSINFTPSQDFVGMAYLTYVACDTLGHCDKTQIDICVLSTDPPATNDTIYLSTSSRAPVTAFLPTDGFTVSEQPGHGDVEEVSGDAWKYTPDNSFSGTDQFVLTKDTSLTRVVIIDVYFVDAPNTFVNDDRFFTRVDQPITFNVRQNDLKKYPLQSYTTPEKGTLVNDTLGIFTYTPDAGFKGAVEFAYTTCFLAHCETGTVTIYVGDMVPENAETYHLISPKDVPLVINYDIPLTGYAFTINALPDDGTLTLHPGENSVDVLCSAVTGYDLLIYEPDADFSGVDAFEIFYCIDGGECHLVKVDVEIVDFGMSMPCPCVAGCVWPGDADGNGEVNMGDVLALGWQVGSVGGAREYPDNTMWMGQHADDWGMAQPGSGMNAKYADSNGDGVVTENDIKSISDHYLWKHTLVPQATGLKADYPFEVIPLTPDLDSGDLAVLEIVIGNEAYPVLDMHGMRFSLNLPPEFVDSSTVDVQFYNDSWLAHDAATISCHEQPWDGRIDAAFTRVNGITAHGIGPISTTIFIIEDDVAGIRPAGTRVPIPVTISGAQGVDGFGRTVDIPAQGTTLYLNIGGEKAEGPADLDDKLFIYPNPASGDMVNIHLNGKREIHDIEVYDMTGQLAAAHTSIYDKHYNLNVSTLQQGMYYVRVIASDGVTGKKFEVIRTQ